jgi:hypothetical protein
MPRRPRIHLAGVPLHIVQRGHNRDACFFGEDDYLAYLHGLGEALKESGCALLRQMRLVEQARSEGMASTPAEKFVYHGQAVQVDLCRQAFDVLRCI